MFWRSSRSDSWCASSSSNASRRCAGMAPGQQFAEIRLARRPMHHRRAHRAAAAGRASRAASAGIQSRTPDAVGLAQRRVDQRAQPRLRHAFGGRVDGRQHFLERRGFRADAAVFGMHDLEAQRAAPHFAEAANARAARQAGLLRAGEIEEAQRQRAGAIGDAAQQLAAAAVRHLGELDFAFDDRARCRDARCRWRIPRAVLVTRRQHEQQVLHLRDAELRELLRQRRPDAAQRRDRALLVHDMWRVRLPPVRV